MTPPATAVEIARLVADALEKDGIPYAIGGALALAYYSPPRATVDLDINIFVDPLLGLDELFATLASVGFTPESDPDTARLQAQTDGQFRGRISNMRLDIFVPAIDYYASLEARRQQVPMLGTPTWILSAEDLVILKMMFYRRKDLADVESLLRHRRDSVDLDFVRKKLGELAGGDDPRLSTLSEIERDVRTT